MKSSLKRLERDRDVDKERREGRIRSKEKER